jgi:hypothetical protein
MLRPGSILLLASILALPCEALAASAETDDEQVVTSDEPAEHPSADEPAATASGATTDQVAADRTDAIPESRPAAPAPAPATQAPVVHGPVPTNVLHRPLLSRDEKQMLAAGVLIVAIPYTFTSLAGAIIIDKAKTGPDELTGERHVDVRRRAYGRSLLVPVVGPFIAIHHGQSAKDRWGAAFSGAVQVAAVGLVGAALISGVRRRRQQRVNMTASIDPGGATIGMTARF